MRLLQRSSVSTTLNPKHLLHQLSLSLRFQKQPLQVYVLILVQLIIARIRMGRSVWWRLTSYRRPRKLRRVSDDGEKTDMELRGREGNDDIVPGGMLEANSRQEPDYVREIGSLKSMEGGSFLSGIRVQSSRQESGPGVVFVFEQASLVLARVNKVDCMGLSFLFIHHHCDIEKIFVLFQSYQILNPDEHGGFMKKHNLDRRDYRPDIIHEVIKLM
ncbi:UNVERIFIED_CONTAM: hypothetical protein Slati_3526200 [Sesamum latifolium]|uniref:Uncharacterized protein n=1 Tax=Sesamum latifolium TaxID=2727402 RepID=A0AAW2UK30_9LAMI